MRWGVAGAALMAAAVIAGIVLPTVLAGTPSSPVPRAHPPLTATAVLLRAARATAAIAVAAYDPFRGTLGELIFDPKTCLYIGDSQIALNNTYMPKGTVNGNAVLQIAVVDKVGQLP